MFIVTQPNLSLIYYWGFGEWKVLELNLWLKLWIKTHLSWHHQSHKQINQRISILQKCKLFLYIYHSPLLTTNEKENSQPLTIASWSVWALLVKGDCTLIAAAIDRTGSTICTKWIVCTIWTKGTLCTTEIGQIKSSG